MTLLLWLAGSSLLWGAALWGAALALQSGNDLSGRARQWIWRGAALLLIAPWLAVPVVGLLAPELSGSLAPPVVFEEPLPTGPFATMVAADPVAVVTAGPAGESPAMPWLEIVVAAMIGGWLVRIAAARLAAWRLGRLVAASRPGGGGALVSLNVWSRRLGLRRTPDLRVVMANISPFSTGIRRAVICLPEGIERGMRADTLDLVMGHECIHVARGDGWRRPLERIIADVMWFNPFAWAIRRELDLARELACDEAVVEASSARRAYARTLRDVAGLTAGLARSAPAASMSLSGSGRLLAMRMKRTLGSATRRPAKAALVGAVMLAIAGAPMAIAQAILIEAAQPQEAPPAPPAPPAAPTQVEVSPDGLVRAPFAARVFETGGDAARGYRVELLQPTQAGGKETCSMNISGLAGLRVSKGQMLAKGDPIGSRGDHHSISRRCSDQTDAQGRPKGAASAPPAPPAPPPPVDAVAPVARPSPPVARDALAPRAPVTPRPHPAPRAAPTAVTPMTPVTPLAPVTPRPAPTPPVSPTPSAAPTPEVTPAPPTPPARPAPIPIQYSGGMRELEGAPNAVLPGPARITSGYGYRVDPNTAETAFHEGVDIAAPFGASVHAPGAGLVTFAGIKGESGRVVELQLADDTNVRFGHLNEIRVQAGDSVRGGDVVGTVGSTSRSTGAHLHLEVFFSGKSHDPQKINGLTLF